MEQLTTLPTNFRDNEKDSIKLMDVGEVDRSVLKRSRQRSSSDPMNSSSFLNIRKKALLKERSASTDDLLDLLNGRPALYRATAVATAALQQSIAASGVRASSRMPAQNSLQAALDLMRDDSNAGEVDLEQCLALFRQMSSRDNNVIDIEVSADNITLPAPEPPQPATLPVIPDRPAAPISLASAESVISVTEELLNMLEGSQAPSIQLPSSAQQPSQVYNHPPMLVQPHLYPYMAPSVPSPHLQHMHSAPVYPPSYPHPHHSVAYSGGPPQSVYNPYPANPYGPPSPASYGYSTTSSSYDPYAPPSSYDSAYRPSSGPPSLNPSPHHGNHFDFPSVPVDVYQQGYIGGMGVSTTQYSLPGPPAGHVPTHIPQYPPNHHNQADYAARFEGMGLGINNGTIKKKKEKMADKANNPNRGNYHCGRCGMLKANHVCAFIDAPPVADKCIQTGLVLRSVHPWQGFEGERFISVKPNGKPK